jgi:hypothetical protein
MDFDPKVDVPSAVPICVRLPHFPLHYWNYESLRAIGSTLGKCIDKFEPRSRMFVCTRICLEVDLEKGLLRAITLKLDNRNHLQKLDYEQLSYMCKSCHEYTHFAKVYKKIAHVQAPTERRTMAIGKKELKIQVKLLLLQLIHKKERWSPQIDLKSLLNQRKNPRQWL